MSNLSTIAASTLRTRSRLAAHAIWDSLVRPDAGAEDPVPWHSDAITPEWLTRHLGHDHGATALGVQITGGDNGSSVRRSLDVTWDTAGEAAGLPSRLFVKVTPTTLTRVSSGMAARAEGYALTQVVPRLDIEAPRCFYSARDKASGRSIHVLADLSASDPVEFCNQTTAISHAQANEIVDTLAELHGTFWSVENDRVDFDAIPLPPYETFFDTGKAGGIRDGHEAAMTKMGNLIPERLQARRNEIWPAAELARDAHGTLPRTIIHSDVHLGNWYITPDGHMGLGDWACACKGLWARDVAYALMTSLAIDDRRRWEGALLERYLDRLKTRFAIDLSWDDAFRAYREQSLTALMMWTPTLCPAPGFPDMQPEAMSIEMIRRLATAMDDLQVLALFDSTAEVC